jgi:hypothetical protein
MAYTLSLAAAALCAAAAPAFAGLTLSLTAGSTATLTPFGPGSTATGSGTLTASTILGWTLQVQDLGTGAGRMRAAATGCAGSAAQLTNPLSVTVTGPLATSAGAKSISATPTTVATGSLALAGTALTTSYNQVIPASEVLRTGCAYSLTATYTLQ